MCACVWRCSTQPEPLDDARDNGETRVELFDDRDHIGEINVAPFYESHETERPADSDVHESAVPA